MVKGLEEDRSEEQDPSVGFTILLLTFLVTPVFAEDPSIGTLVVDVKSLESDVKIKKNVRKQLEHAGLKWELATMCLSSP